MTSKSPTPEEARALAKKLRGLALLSNVLTTMQATADMLEALAAENERLQQHEVDFTPQRALRAIVRPRPDKHSCKSGGQDHECG